MLSGLNTASSKAWKAIARFRSKNISGKISSILNDVDLPAYLNSEQLFSKLQDRYQGVPEYGYDSLSTWSRGVGRAKRLLELGGLKAIGQNIVDVGCGDGMTGTLLHGYGHDVTLVDLDDWRDARAKATHFVRSDIGVGLNLESDRFDLAYSYNAFEHFPDPELALMEMLRVCKPGGLLYLEFSPLFASPWGWHAYRTLRMPYSQFLFPQEFTLKKLQELGIKDLGQDRVTLQPLNRWTLNQFTELWKKSRCDILLCNLGLIDDHLEIITQYPHSFRGRGLTLADVRTHGISVLLRKPNFN